MRDPMTLAEFAKVLRDNESTFSLGIAQVFSEEWAIPPEDQPSFSAGVRLAVRVIADLGDECADGGGSQTAKSLVEKLYSMVRS